MPLHDHFQEPLASRYSWTSITSAWATYLAEDLNDRLPERFYATPNAQFAIEIDVATWEKPGHTSASEQPAESLWSPATPQLTLPFLLTTEVIEVRVTHLYGGPILVGAVGLLSPGNKDRPAAREAFVSKCATFLHEGVGLVVADVVTVRRANLHRLLLDRVSPGSPHDSDADLYAAAYRPTGGKGETQLEIWHEALAVGAPLPTLPLWLREGPCLKLDLEATYMKALQKLRVPGNGGSGGQSPTKG